MASVTVPTGGGLWCLAFKDLSPLASMAMETLANGHFFGVEGSRAMEARNTEVGVRPVGGFERTGCLSNKKPMEGKNVA